tara:strand:- start:211 stop:414 length:204 start_codon:yes stop_codon:yes gene_type:complete
MSLNWILIPWSQQSTRNMTYKDLLEQLQEMDDKQLKDQVVCYDIANDRYVPAYQSCLTEDDELIIAF